MSRACPRPLRPRAQHGAVLVELALVLPLLVFLLLATVEFAQALASYQVVLKQVRAAARHLSTRAPGNGHVEAECLLRTGRLSASLPCGGPVVLPPSANPLGVRVEDALNAPSTHRARSTATDASSLGAVTVNLVTVTVTGFSHPLHFAGLLRPATGGAAALPFGPISMTLRQAG